MSQAKIEYSIPRFVLIRRNPLKRRACNVLSQLRNPRNDEHRFQTIVWAAIAACVAVADNVERLNGALAYGLLEPLRFGIGIHAG